MGKCEAVTGRKRLAMGQKMRITCPNCQAQYDIDPAMIPATGRDVQCSNCAHTWLEYGPHAAPVAEEPEPETAEAAVAEEPADAAVEDESQDIEAAAEEQIAEASADEEPDPTEGASPTDDDPDGEAEGEAADPADKVRAAMDRARTETTDPEPAPEEFLSDMRDAVADPDAGADDAAIDEADKGDTADEAPEDPAADEVIEASEDEAQKDEEADLAVAMAAEEPVDDTEDDAAKPALDTEVADILREEAEREVTQRRSEDSPPALEAQGDLGLPEDAPSEVLRERLDRMRGDGVPKSTVAETLAAATATPLDGPRRERLPDIEEIKTTLRPGDVTPDDEPPIGPSEMIRIRQRGFRRGFATCVLVAGILVVGYVFAPEIIGIVPASEPFMMSYVETANGIRDGIDQVMARAITGIEGLGGGADAG